MGSYDLPSILMECTGDTMGYTIHNVTFSVCLKRWKTPTCNFNKTMMKKHQILGYNFVKQTHR